MNNITNWMGRKNSVTHENDEHVADRISELLQGDYLLVEVTDSGSGISKLLIENMFDEYLSNAKYDLSSSNSKRRGLGLPISKGK